MSEIEWTKDGPNYVGTINTNGPGTRRTGQYIIYLTRRPGYCDRGDWLIKIEHVGDPLASTIDDADGFPRYFFGDAMDAKDQMRLWALRRKECQ